MAACRPIRPVLCDFLHENIKMNADLNAIPPTVLLLITEVAAKSATPNDARKNLKRLLPELQRQSLFYQETSASRSAVNGHPTDLNIFADGALNLLDERIGCAYIGCRLEAARRFARSLGLLGDTVWVTDSLTEQFLEDHALDEVRFQKILGDIAVLLELFPLIISGIIKFRSPWRPVCGGCHAVFEDHVHRITSELFTEYSSEFSVENMDFGFSLDTGTIYSPPIITRVFPAKWRGAHRTPLPEEVIRQILSTAVRSALWSSSEASDKNGVVFSNSNLGMAALARQEGWIRGRREVRVFDESRNINLPWVSDLNAEQILQLRSEASLALPALRELMSRHLSSTDIKNYSAADVIGELREQAIEVRNELESTKRNSGRYWKTAYATLGLGISAYGIGSGQVAASIAGLLPILQLLIQHETGTEHQLDKMRRRPGYVLLKASDILQHAH